MNKREENESHKCPLCGNEFYKGESTACDVCPMGPKCKLIKCPNCGYEFIPGVDER